MQNGPTWQHVMLHNLPACPCVQRKDGRDYAVVTCPDCNGAGVARESAETGERIITRARLRDLAACAGKAAT